MQNKKSDFRKFAETMWIMVKYDVLPWVIGGAAFAIFVVELRNSVKELENNEEQQYKVIRMPEQSVFEKQR